MYTLQCWRDSFINKMLLGSTPRILHTFTDETRNFIKIATMMDFENRATFLLMKDHASTEKYTWKITDFGVSVIHDKAPKHVN